jgi:hypothetical protein
VKQRLARYDVGLDLNGNKIADMRGVLSGVYSNGRHPYSIRDSNLDVGQHFCKCRVVNSCESLTTQQSLFNS